MSATTHCRECPYLHTSDTYPVSRSVLGDHTRLTDRFPQLHNAQAFLHQYSPITVRRHDRRQVTTPGHCRQMSAVASSRRQFSAPSDCRQAAAFAHRQQMFTITRQLMLSRLRAADKYVFDLYCIPRLH